MKHQEKRRLDYRAPKFSITDTELFFDLDLKKTKVTQRSHLVRLTEDKSAPLVLDGDSLKLISVKVDGQDCSFVETPDTLTISDVGDEFLLEIVTEIFPEDNTELMGLYVSDGKFCTQNEPQGFRRITYFLDRSDVLARYTTHISAPDGLYPFMLSNGNLISDVKENGIRTVTWEDPFPKPSYLFALVAGDFDELKREFTTKSGRKVDVRLYVDKGQASYGTVAIESILKAMAWDEKRFGFEYDLERFNVVSVDFFNAGAMENKSLNIFNSKYVLVNPESATDTDFENVLSVIGHEYFHNWTGDRITVQDWFQLSLKEGLTVFRDQEFSSDLGCRPIERLKAIKVIRGPQFAEDAGPMAHPIRPDYVMEMNNFYSVTVYDKGAEVIRMIHTILGEEKFQEGMKLYVKRHDGKAVTCDDFVKAMQDASGINLERFKNWYSQSGTPVVTAAMKWNQETQTCTIYISQKTPETPRQPEKKPFVIPIQMSFYGINGNEIPLVQNGKPVSKVQILDTESAEWVFENVPEAPVPAFLENFSAPVRFEYPYSEQELSVLLKYAKDPVARFDAVQMLVNNYFIKNVCNYEVKLDFSEPTSIIDAFKYILSSDMDRRFKAFILTLPSINTLMENFRVINIDAIIAVREFLVAKIGSELSQEFDACFKILSEEYHKRISTKTPYETSDEQMGERALIGVVLSYLARSLKNRDLAKEASELVLEHFKLSDNMTDTLAAMNIAVNLDLVSKDEILKAFEERWQNNPLVFDNYFRAVAMAENPNVLENVKKLMSHKCFDIGNPNRVRALVGAFVMNNPKYFHALDGKGYDFLMEIVTKLNSSNPQVAARLMTPLLIIARLDVKRREMIRKHFEKLLAMPNLATALYELIDKSMRQLN